MESRKTGARIAAERVFAALTGVTLLGSLAAMLSWAPDRMTPMWLTVLRLLTVGTGLVLTDRKDWGFRILAGYMALVFLRLLIPSPQILFSQTASETLFNGAWALIGCYALGHVLGRERTERWLKIFLTCWMLGMACFSSTGIYAAWTDRRIWNIGEGAWWGFNIVSGTRSSRLNMLFDANTSGVLAGIAMVAGFLMAAGCKNKWGKGLYVLLILPNWTALALTDSRTAQVSAAVGIGAAAGILVLKHLAKKQPEGKHLVTWAAAAGTAVMTAALCAALLIGTTSAFNAVKTAQGGLVPGASAEGETAQMEPLEAYVAPKEAAAGYGEKVKLKAKTDNKVGRASYQWQYSTDGENWKDLAGATKRTLKVKGSAPAYKRKYRCIVTAKNGTAVTDEAVILKPYTVKISVKTKKKADGDQAIITAKTDEAKGKLAYQWQVSEDGGKTWKDVTGSGSKKKTLTVNVSGVKKYRCKVKAENGIVFSNNKTVRQPKGTTVKNRGLGGDDPLSGRLQIWKQVIRYLIRNPKTLLTGRSVAEPMQGTQIMRTKNTLTEHCHNMFLQTVMENGIPGLLLMAAFMLLTIRRSWRLVMTEGRTLLALLPAALCALWTGEMTESIVRMFNYRIPALGILMLYAGVVCALGKEKPKDRKEEGNV